MERIKAIVEDDVKFQKIKSLPKRCRFYSAHRQLSWQCQRDVNKLERDAKMVTLEVSRNQAMFRDRLEKLNATKRHLVTEQIQRVRADAGFPAYRRKSCPNFSTAEMAAAVAAASTADDSGDAENFTTDHPLRREHTVDVGSLTNTGKSKLLRRSHTIDESSEMEKRLDLDAAVRRFTMPHVQFSNSSDGDAESS